MEAAKKDETKAATKEEPAGAWKSQSEMERAFGAAADEMDPNPNPNPVRVENDRDVAYDRAREKVEARIDEREEKILRDFDGARYLR